MFVPPLHHTSTPGEYMGHCRSTKVSYSGRDSYHRDLYRDRDHRLSDRDSDRDPYGGTGATLRALARIMPDVVPCFSYQ